ncbi:MAG: glucose-1-phosphate adenylyltransferase [Parcubacteria group bacterium 20-58-5]|nr:MAG: glucose-1-phosphate adenylyltransferase [Parcubacteria group bacterium 20-58-5]
MFQNIDIIESYGPEFIVILAGDHVYKMDYGPMLAQHVEQRADVTIGCIEVPRAEASGFGIMDVDASDRVTSFIEKPKEPPAMLGKPGVSLASMGIYVFSTRFLVEQLRRDAEDPASSRDFGKDIIPYLVCHGKAVAHPFSRSCRRSGYESEAYWRDVGTVDAYYEANIDLTNPMPELDLYEQDWPIWTYAEINPPAKFVHDVEGRRGQALASLVSGGCIISGAVLRNSLLFTNVRVHSYAEIEGAVILPSADIGRGARLTKVIVEKNVQIPPGLVVGEDPLADAARFRRSAKGVCLITQPMIDRLRA